MSGFRKTLRLSDLVFMGLILIQPTAPMPLFGVVSNLAGGHVVTAILLALVGMLFTAISYGRMARIYPSALVPRAVASAPAPVGQQGRGS